MEEVKRLFATFEAAIVIFDGVYGENDSLLGLGPDKRNVRGT